MTQLEGDQVDQLLEAVAARLPATWPQRGGGWPYEIEAALIDAVLSIRNRYGKSPTSGVRVGDPAPEQARNARGRSRTPGTAGSRPARLGAGHPV